MKAKAFPVSSPEGGDTGGTVRIVEETYLPGIHVSRVARRHGSGGNQIFT